MNSTTIEPRDQHYLVLTWAEEPDDPTFCDDIDWKISHPPSCEWDSVLRGFKCALQYEVDNIGVEAFGWTPEGRADDWSATPAIFPIEHYHHVVHIGYSTEHETGIRECGSLT